MKKRRKPNLKNDNSLTWRNKADKAWKEEVHKVGHCEICGRKTGLNAHHLIARTRLRFRHDLSNGILLCSRCHNFDSNVSPHVDSFSGERFLEWLRINRPGQYEWYQENKEDKRMPDKSYKECYDELTGG
jgi:ribosomal protein S14